MGQGLLQLVLVLLGKAGPGAGDKPAGSAQLHQIENLKEGGTGAGHGPVQQVVVGFHAVFGTGPHIGERLAQHCADQGSEQIYILLAKMAIARRRAIIAGTAGQQGEGGASGQQGTTGGAQLEKAAAIESLIHNALYIVVSGYL